MQKTETDHSDTKSDKNYLNIHTRVRLHSATTRGGSTRMALSRQNLSDWSRPESEIEMWATEENEIQPLASAVPAVPKVKLCRPYAIFDQDVR